MVPARRLMRAQMLISSRRSLAVVTRPRPLPWSRPLISWIQGELVLGDGAAFAGTAGGDPFGWDAGAPGNAGDGCPCGPGAGQVVDDCHFGVIHPYCRSPLIAAQPRDGGHDLAGAFDADRELDTAFDTGLGQVRGKIAGIPAAPDLLDIVG